MNIDLTPQELEVALDALTFFVEEHVNDGPHAVGALRKLEDAQNAA